MFLHGMNIQVPPHVDLRLNAMCESVHDIRFEFCGSLQKIQKDLEAELQVLKAGSYFLYHCNPILSYRRTATWHSGSVDLYSGIFAIKEIAENA